MLTGRRVAAEEALSLGVVQRVVPAATILENATALAAEIGKGSPAAVRNYRSGKSTRSNSPFGSGTCSRRSNSP